ESLPAAVAPCLEPDGLGALAHRRHLGCELQDVAAQGVHGPEDGAEGALRVQVDFVAADLEIAEPEAPVPFPRTMLHVESAHRRHAAGFRLRNVWWTRAAYDRNSAFDSHRLDPVASHESE